MKTLLLNTLIFLTLSSSLFGANLTYTTTVNSSPGQNYYVNITIVLTDVIPAQNNCAYGYNFDIAYDYDVEIIDNGNGNGNGNGNSNNSIGLHTLQGYLTCGGNSGIYFDLPNNGGSGSSITQGNSWNSNSDCATSTVESLACQFIDLQIQGPGIPDQYINLQPTPTLPVEWLNFEVNNNNNSVELNWSTASEKNNDYFTVEKSIDGKKWVSLTEISGAGNTNSTSNYSWSDNNPTIGSSYYRIKQTDFDGQTDYSAIKSCNFEGGDIELYPNPAQNIINIKSKGSISQIVVLNNFGQDVTSRVSKVGSTQLDLSALPTGFYTLIVDGKSSKFQKL